MASQEEGLQVLEKISEWPSDKLKCHLDEVLPQLLSCLSHVDKGNVLPALHALLVTCLPCVPISSADRDILKYALPAARQLFSESLEGIRLRLADISVAHEDDLVDTVSSLLLVCVELLKCLDSVLVYIVSQGNVLATDISITPITVVSVMLETFQHCKESEMLYGSVFSNVADNLSLLFRQCYQVQTHFHEVLTIHLHFDCSLEDDLCLLVDILQILCQIGEQVIGLDVKAMAEHWKGFAKLVQQYLESLKQRFDISYPLRYLSQEVERSVELLIKSDISLDLKSASKQLKSTSFILKIIVKLSEQFGSGGGFLGNCCGNLLQLLLCLFRCSPSSLILKAMDSHFVNELERHLTVATDPLLMHLINEVDFRQEYFRMSKKICNKPEEIHSYFLLNMAMMKRLLHCSLEERDKWLEEDRDWNIVGGLLECLKFGHFELCSEVQVVVRSGYCGLYEGLVSHCAALLVSGSASQFSTLEGILLDAIIQSHFWPAMLAADVWCVCVRVGSADLASDLVLYLADIVSIAETSNIKGKQNYQHISLLLRRMFPLLGSKGKQTMVERFPFSEHPCLWKVVGLSNLPKPVQDVAEHSLVSKVVMSVSAFLNSSSFSTFKDMYFSLFGLSATLDCRQLSNAELSHDASATVTQLWNLVAGDALWNDCDSAHESWLPKSVEMLCACTEYLIQTMTDFQIKQILYQLEKIVNCKSVTPKLSSLKVLRGLASKDLGNSVIQFQICSLIASIFQNLLQDSNPIIMESALETFEYFAHITTNETILAEAVGVNERVQELVAQYLKKESLTSSPLDSHNYFTFQGNQYFVHLCKLRKQKIRSPSPEQRALKKIRSEDLPDLSSFLEDDLLIEVMENDVSEVVNRICEDSQLLLSSSLFRNISSSLQERLKIATQNLQKFVNQ